MGHNVVPSDFRVSRDPRHFFCVAPDLDPFPGKDFLRNRSCGHPTGGFPAAGAAGAPPVPEAPIFDVKGVIRVPGPHSLHDPGILFDMERLRIDVVDDHADRGAGGVTVKNAGHDLHPVFFLTGRTDGALTRTAAVEFVLDLLLRDGQSRRHPVHNDL